MLGFFFAGNLNLGKLIKLPASRWPGVLEPYIASITLVGFMYLA
jgi:hypothetical protein